MIIKFIILILSALFWTLGGWGKEDGNPVPWKGWRDVLIPIMLGIYLGFVINWWIGLICIGTLQIIRIGYGAYDPEHDDKPSLLAKITHDREGWLNRAIAGLLYSFFGTLPAIIYLITHGGLTNSFIQVWIGYCLINVSLGGILCGIRANAFIIEPVIGAALSLLVFIF